MPIDGERVQLTCPAPEDGSERGRRIVEAITNERLPTGVLLELELGPLGAEPGASATLEGRLPLGCSVRQPGGR